MIPTKMMKTHVVLLMALVLLAAGCSKTKLVLEDMHVAVWMPVTNDFAVPQPPGSGPYHPWGGVLFQFGDFPVTGTGFGSIEIKEKGGAVTSYNSSQFVWVNIVANSPDGTVPPMNFSHLPFLLDHPSLPAPAPTWACAGIDTYSETDVLCTTPPCPPGTLGKLHHECLRLRALHHDVVPQAVMTYWNGMKGFNLQTRAGLTGGADHTYAFELLDDAVVEVFKDDGTVLLSSDRVVSITVKSDSPPTDHGLSHDPPWPTW